jgi:hypothetical protein
MKRMCVGIAGTVLALATMLPGTASAGPPKQQVGLINVLIAVAAYKMRARHAGCLIASCSDRGNRATVRNERRAPPSPPLLAAAGHERRH